MWLPPLWSFWKLFISHLGQADWLRNPQTNWKHFLLEIGKMDEHGLGMEILEIQLPCKASVLVAFPHCGSFFISCVGFSSSTHVSAQCVAWLNAGWVLSSSAMTWQKTQQTCWWRRFSCILHPLLHPGIYGLFLAIPLLSLVCLHTFFVFILNIPLFVQ